MTSPIRLMATLGAWSYLAVTGMQLSLVFLAAPAATAGAVCLDRARGTLTHMLVTDLSNSEIVLGKLAARLIPVFGLVACTLPLMEILTLVGGLDPNALLGAFAVTIGIALLGCSLAFLFSLWVSRTHEALLCTYAVWAVWLFWAPITSMVRVMQPGTWLLPPPPAADPFWLVFAPYLHPERVGWEDYAWFLGTTSGISVLLLGVAVLRVRAIVTRDAVKRGPSRSFLGRLGERLAAGLRYVPGPSLDGNPVFWREWHRSRPSRWARAVSMLYFFIAGIFSAMAVALQHNTFAPWLNGFQLIVGLLILSVTASASMAEERARGGLDLLMTTMLSTREIVLGKWLGTFREVPLLAVLPAAVAFGFVYNRPERWIEVGRLILYVLCAGAAITSLGLAMAIWHERVGRAVAATVAVYVAFTIGWFFLALFVRGGGPGSEGLLLASPFMWMLVKTAMITEAIPTGVTDHFLVWEIIWPVALAITAVALLFSSLWNFDRKLGRAAGPALRLVHGEFTRFERAFGTVFVAVAAFASLMAMFMSGDVAPLVVINGAQVSLGLFIAAMAAALSSGRQLGPEAGAQAPRFGRSSPRNVLAKWLGPFRLVALISVLATFAGLGHWDFRRDPFHTIWLIPIEILAGGAAWCSLGVALGIWLPRRSALVFTALICGLVLTIGPICGGLILEEGQSEIAWMSSPMVAASALTMVESGGAPTGFDAFSSLPVVMVANVFATIVLLAAAIVGLERRSARKPKVVPLAEVV